MPDEKRTSGSGVRLLAKVGPPQFMEALIERGLVHMQRADYYAKGEASADPARIDKWEGARHIGQARRIKSLRLHDPKGDIELAPHLVGQLLFNPGGPQEPHIYCMYALTMPALYAAHADGHRQPIDPRIADFGSAAIVFKDS